MAFTVHSKDGKGRNARKTPSTMISAAVARKIVRKGSFRTATKLMTKGSRNRAMEIESPVKMLAMVPFSLKISMQEGVMLVSRKELAMPLTMARA